MLLGNDNTASALFILGVLLIVGVVLRNSRRRRKSTAPLPISRWGQQGPPAATAPRDASVQMAHWEVGMHDLARELSGQLNTKIAIVERLVRDANQAAERLEALIERASLTDLNRNATTVASVRTQTKASAGPHDRQSRICQLARRGYSSVHIAEEIGAPVGEVELVLSLQSVD